MIKWKKQIYIATQKEIIKNEYGQEITNYNIPKLYNFNVQPNKGDYKLQEYGNKDEGSMIAIISNTYIGKFKKGDIAYLEGVLPDEYNSNYNYYIEDVREGNIRIAIYFTKIQK